jgi:hypothetical protein
MGPSGNDQEVVGSNPGTVLEGCSLHKLGTPQKCIFKKTCLKLIRVCRRRRPRCTSRLSRSHRREPRHRPRLR